MLSILIHPIGIKKIVSPINYIISLYALSFVLGLLMKTKGYSPCVERICAELDSNLLILLQDLQHYLQNATTSNKIADRSDLQDHLQNCSIESIQQ